MSSDFVPQQYTSKDVFVVIKVFVVLINTILFSVAFVELKWLNILINMDKKEFGVICFFMVFMQAIILDHRSFQILFSFFILELSFLLTKNVSSDEKTSCDVSEFLSMTVASMLLAWN